jgi:hypothetical protein
VLGVGRQQGIDDGLLGLVVDLADEVVVALGAYRQQTRSCEARLMMPPALRAAFTAVFNIACMIFVQAVLIQSPILP